MQQTQQKLTLTASKPTISKTEIAIFFILSKTKYLLIHLDEVPFHYLNFI